MPTHILLHRHEEAESHGPDGDATRSLTPEGRRRMLRQAASMGDLVPALDRILTSPLVRAVQTAEILLAAGPFDPGTPIRAHGAIAHPLSLVQLLHLAEAEPTPNGFVAIVGHEPTLSSLVAHVAPGTPPALGFRTGQAVLLGPPGPQGRRPVLGTLRGGAAL